MLKSLSTGNSLNFRTPGKPLDEINKIVSSISPFCTPVIFPAGRVINTRQGGGPCIIFVNNGTVSVCRQSDDISIGLLAAPTILGLIDGYASLHNIKNDAATYFLTESDCFCRIIPLDLFVNKADEFNLWKDIARILTCRILAMTFRDRVMVGQDAYGKVRSLLLDIWNYPEETRNEINVQRFIQQRTGLSRSCIYQIIQELRTGDYIKILHGRLINLKSLPERR